MDFVERIYEHRLAYHESKTGEVRCYPVFEVDLYGWEKYTLDKAWREGWDLFNIAPGTPNRKELALQFMQDHLPKTYATYRKAHDGKGHRC